jgi:hypothetical protein
MMSIVAVFQDIDEVFSFLAHDKKVRVTQQKSRGPSKKSLREPLT